MPRFVPLVSMKVLVVDDELLERSARGRAVRELCRELRDRDIVVVEATSAEDGRAVLLSDPSLSGVLLQWTMGDEPSVHDKSKALIGLLRSRDARLPVFLMAERQDAATLTMDVMREVTN